MGKHLPDFSQRVEVYREVRKLAERGVTDRGSIVRELLNTGFVPPSRETIMRWVQGKTSPLTGVRQFDPAPSEELSFFIGAWLGDGWGDENDGGKRLLLKVRSYDFAKEFADCAAKILGKTDSYWVRRVIDSRGKWYLVKVTSIILYGFLNQGTDELVRTAGMCPKGFLRGFYTAEGCPSVSVERSPTTYLGIGVVVSNADYQLLLFVSSLLLSMGLSPGRTRLNRGQGKKTNLGVVRAPQWLLTLSSLRDLDRFVSEIGFADSEKQTKLIDALDFYHRFGRRKAVDVWLDNYVKLGKKWVKEKRTLTA
jgi:intein-encoded DNA endonuclease-like protein